MKKTVESIVSRAKRKGFVYPGSDIYGGLQNARDYGPYGALLRKNIYDLIIKTFVQERNDILFMDAALLMNPKVREASGHVATFNDPLIDDKNTKERFRADKIIEDYFENERNQGLSDEQILQQTQKEVSADIPNLIPDSWTLEQQHQFIIKNIPNNPNTKKKADWTEVRKFSLMLGTELGVFEGKGSKVRMRPETAQGIYVNFKNLRDTTRMRIPFGAIQIGKAFRNEITPGNFIFRTREFEQAEMQYFVEPGTNAKFFKMFEELYRDFRVNKIGIKRENLRQRDHEKDELAFYAAQARDFEYNFPRGWGELQGIHDRTDYDLSNHAKHSGADLQYHDPITGKRYIPNIIETALGLGRAMFVAMIDAYEEETYTDSNDRQATRTVVKFHPNIAPIKFAILPLIKKDEKQVEIADALFKKLSSDYMCEYDEQGAIGKRYRRQDEIGTPYCITIDQQSVADLESGKAMEEVTVTLRNRDTMEQKRVKFGEVKL